MKAAIFQSYGAVDVLEVAEVPIPMPRGAEVLVRVSACSINPRDANVRRGDLRLIAGRRFPKGTGADVSGVVAAVGSNVTGFVEGDEVFGYIDDVNGGGAAEFVALPARALAKKPAALRHIEAAALPCAYLTALQGLRTARVASGQHVLVYGASGGVGTAMLQLCRHFGARTTAVASARNAAYCLENGADAVLDSSSPDVFASGPRYDAVLQVYSAGGLLYDRAKHMLHREGVFLTLIPNPAYVLKALVARPRFAFMLVRSNALDLTKLGQLATGGAIEPRVTSVFRLDEIRDAHRRIETGHVTGKLVIVLN